MSALWRFGARGVVRSDDAVADEAREEIAFHIECKVRDLVDAGASEESARRTAEAAFGDVETVVRQCVWERNGDLVIMQRILFGLVGLLACGLAFLVWQNLALLAEARTTERELLQARQELARERIEHRRTAAETSESDRAMAATPVGERTMAPPEPAAEVVLDVENWRARLAQRPLDARHCRMLTRQLAALPADDGWRLLAELWPSLSSVARRAALLSFAEAQHEHMLDVVDLCVADPQVRNEAFDLLRGVALRDYRDDPAGYALWRAATKGQTRAAAMRLSAGPFVLRLQGMSATHGMTMLELLELQRALRDDEDLAFALRDSGALAVVEGWLREGPSASAFEFARSMGADDAWLQANVMPFAADKSCDAETRAAACAAISRKGATWAIPVVEEFARGYLNGLAPGSVEIGSADGRLLRSVSGLVEIGDPRAIPVMIAMIRDDKSGAAIYNVGYFGLSKLTGVWFDEEHDGDWWVQWWHDNQQHLPASIRGMTLPN